MSGDIADLYGEAVPTDREDAATGFEALPPGWYSVLIEAAEVRDNKAGTGKYLWLELTVVGESYANRKLFARITLVNPNEKAVEIGMRELAALGQACELAAISDTSELIDKVIDVRVKIGKPRDGYDADNEITAYAPHGTKSGGGEAAPAAKAPAKKAWGGGRQQAAAPAPSPKPAAKRPWER